MRDIVIPKVQQDQEDGRIDFEINDVKLLIDPIQISIYKEGLNYSWKTLRTKASSKIVNGNSIFHLKLNLIFTKSMFLEMHRLVCQIRNTPYVQITNELISESTSNNLNAPVFFTVNSLQIMPRADSPFTVDMELDLRYFNHKPYGSLLYKDKFETLPYLKKDKQYVYTFDVFPDENGNDSRVELEVENVKTNAKRNRKTVNNNTFLKRSIKKYNSTTPQVKASNSNAYKRYSNYLQIKNLIECFNFTSDYLSSLLTSSGVNARNVVSLCDIDKLVKEEIYNHQNVYGRNNGGTGSSGYIATIFTYQDYALLKLKKDTTKNLRKYFESKVKDIKDYAKRRQRIQELKNEFIEKVRESSDGRVGKFDFKDFKKQIDLFEDPTLNYYTGRSSVNNVVFSNKTITVSQDENVFSNGQLPSNACITSFSCGFTNMFSTIPIAGQEYPTHQYLGASEPVFNVNILLPSEKSGDIGPDRGLGDVGKSFESMRLSLQRNAKDFKRIPDAGYFGVENFFTKLLGSKKTQIDSASNKSRNNFILRNFNVSTIEGAPGSKSLQFSFCETNDFVEEELGRVYTRGGSNEYLNRVNELFMKSAQRPRKESRSTSYSFKNWSTRYFSSDPTSPNDYYYSWVKRGRNLNLITKEQDRKAYEFCRDYLDPIQDALGGKDLNIGSSIDVPSTGTRKTASRHYSGAAVDISVKDMTPAELAVVIEKALPLEEFGLIAYYPNEEDFKSGQKKMTGFLEKSFFVHIDDRTVVNRTYKVDANGDRTYIDDEIEITKTQAGSYYGLDIAGALRGKPQNKSVEDFYKIDNENFEIPNPDSLDLEESDVDIEDVLNSIELRQRLKTYINPFSADIEKEYEDVEVTRYKDLGEAEQTIVAKIRPNPDSVNPELEVSIIEESNASRQADLESSLKKQGINYKKEGDKFFIPRSSSNVGITVKNKQIEAYLTMLDNFYKLASLMLTEPKLYMNSKDEAAAEKERIRRVLKDDKITPILFNSFKKFFENIGSSQEFLQSYFMLATEAAGTAYGVSSVAAAGPGNPIQKIGGVIGAILSGTFLAATASNISEANDGVQRYVECMSFIERIHRNNNIISEYEEFREVVPEGFEIKQDESFSDFFQNIASADQVPLNFGKVSHYIIYESNLIKDFSTSATNIVPKSKVALALGTYSDIKKTVDDKGYQLKGALSETLFMGELKRYHQYIFEFPYVDDTVFKEEDFYDLYSLKEDGLYGEYKRDREARKYIPYEQGTSNKLAHEYLYSVNQNVDQGVANLDIPFTKEALKERQDNKLEYLKNLKESILEELGEFPEIQEALGVNREISIFELAQENAYPDITLPVDPAQINSNANLHPTFYFYDPVEEGATRFDYMRPELLANASYVIDKTNAFHKALESGIFSGSERDLVKSGKGLELEISDFPTFEKILIDKNDETPAKLPNQAAAPTANSKASQTSITTPGSASSNPENQKQLFEDRKKKFDALNQSFENMFGEVGNKPTTGRKSEEPIERLKNEAKESCKTLLKPKKDIKKAFPTYRLYIIEEDSVESDKLSIYDDFYSYNGVKGFTVYSNKKLPASTAVIQLQNVSGVLDGTKPEVVRDIDIDQNLKPEEEAQQQASVSSVVMRPGINIQLRAGYESNPNKLDIIFTGRVTELKNSSAGEMIEVVAQSFGTELVARKYGLQSNSPIKEKTFYNTHSLLGTLMLSEELKHFGRVKKGRLFQRGENKQISLDLDTGKNDDWFNFNVLSWTQRFFEDYGVYILLATGLAQGASGLIRRGAAGGSKFFLGVQNQFQKISNADLIKGKVTQAVAYTQSLSAVSLLSRVGDKVVGMRAILGGLRWAGTQMGNIAKAIFITTPVKIREIIEKVTLSKYLAGKDIAAIKAARDQVRIRRPADVDPIVFKGFLGKTWLRIFGRGRSNLNLDIAQFDRLVISRFGYGYAAKQGLLKSETSVGLFRAFTSSSQLFTFTGGGSLIRNFTTNYITALYISAMIDLVIMAYNGMAGGLGYLWGEKLNPTTTKIMLSPQDDNIYPPSPNKYLVQSSGFDAFVNRLKEGGKSAFWTLTKASLGILGYGPSSFDDDTQAKLLKNAYLKADNRLSISKKENEYVVSSSTIWEVLHEMSLRHPGYLYGVRKYGDGLESRVFFGYSNQRCFVKDLPAREIQLLNKIEAAINRMTDKDASFSPSTIENIKNLPEGSVAEADTGTKTNEILEYWISKTSERFIPFRKYHSVDSEHDIIANNLRVQNNKVVNQVAVTFRERESGREEEKIHIMKAIPHLSEDRVNEKGINYVNCKGYASACRYGMGELIHSAKEMYGGEILIMGNPKIDTNDICILTDDYSNMHGLFEVEAVTHMFSYETGFVTELVPNAVVFGNENYLGSISSSSIVFDAHRKLVDTYTNYNQLLVEGEVSDEKITEIAEDTLIEVFSESGSDTYNKLYSWLGAIGLTDYSELASKDKERLIQEIKDSLKATLKRGDAIFLEDITESLNTSILEAPIFRASALTGAVTTGVTALLTRNISTALRAGVGVGVGTSLAGKGAVSSIKTGYLGKNIFRDLLMTQIEAGHIIKLLPIVKDGNPLVSGGYEYLKQHQRYKDVFGNFFNPLSDAVEGFTTRVRELEEDYKMLGVNTYDGGFSMNLRRVPVYLSGVAAEFLSADAIPAEAVWMQLELKDE